MEKKTFQELVTEETSGIHARMEALRSRRGWMKKAVAISVAILAKLQEKKWSQAELARAAGVSPQYISRIIKAEENLSLETITKLESALGTELITIIAPQLHSATLISKSFYHADSAIKTTKSIGEIITNKTTDVIEQVVFSIEPTAA
jgi:transcriptional regulator with XRE-family HTH domain